MPNVAQAWRLMPPGTDMVAGESGIYNEISWIVTLRPTPPGFDRLRGKELALVDAATADLLDITLSYLITSLAEQGASALGILGEVSPAAKDTANHYKIPILHLPPATDLAALEAQIREPPRGAGASLPARAGSHQGTDGNSPGGAGRRRHLAEAEGADRTEHRLAGPGLHAAFSRRRREVPQNPADAGPPLYEPAVRHHRLPAGQPPGRAYQPHRG